MSDWKRGSFPLAFEDFRRARSRARLEQVFARLRGESAELLCYTDVQQAVKPISRTERGLQEIPLDAIVGSVGRCSDFTRTFLPLRDESRDHWARIELATTDLVGLPPIEVYRVDQAYFVLDGNHRVSVARQLGATHIQAFVTEFHTRVPVSPDVRPDDLIVKAEYAGFLELTNIDRLRPGADLYVSVPGQYRQLADHIAFHQHLMQMDHEREIPYEEAVRDWYDRVYMPVVTAVREYGLLHDFPARTETDLYVWISEHHNALEERYGEEVRIEDAARDFSARSRGRLRRLLATLKHKAGAVAGWPRMTRR